MTSVSSQVKEAPAEYSMFVQFNIISGFMLGIEFIWDASIVVFDLGIFRIYVGKIPESEQDE